MQCLGSIGLSEMLTWTVKANEKAQSVDWLIGDVAF